MAICQITYVTKNPRQDPHHPIEEVGGPVPDGFGSIWRCTLEVAVNAALSGRCTFQTVINGVTTPVEVIRGPSGHYHLRTVPDGLLGNNLLSLPNFPPALLGRAVYTEPMGLVATSRRGGLLGRAGAV